MKKNYASSWSSWRQVNRLKMIASMVIFLSLGLAFNANAQVGTIQVGSGTQTITSSTGILASNYNYNYSQQIVTSNEYFSGGGAVGNITKIRYNATNIGTLTNWNDWTVYIGNTTKTSFTSTTDWVPVAQMTQVFSGLITAVNNDWFEITFTAPFAYTGGNIVIAVDENSPGYSTVPVFKAYTSSANTAIFYRVDAIASNPDPTAPPTASALASIVPQIQFEGTLATCPPPLNVLVNGVTNNTATIGWTANGPATTWDIELGANGFTPTGVATQTVNATTAVFSTLTPSTTYQFYIRSYCSAADQSPWVGPFTFATTQIPAVVPFSDNFTSNQWTAVNPTQTNKWFVGAGAGNPANGMYISNDNGVTNAYTITSASTSKIYRDITFPASTNPFNFQFDWKAFGESSIDVIRVWMVPSTAVITEGVQINTTNTPGAIQIGANFNQSNAWTTANFILPAATYAGTSKRLVFEWRNDGSVGTQTPAAIDNIDFTIITCPAPTALTATNVATTSADLSWTANGIASDFDIEWGPAGFTPTGTPTISFSSNPTPLTSLTSSTTYSYYVRAACSPTEQSLWVGPYTFTTLQIPAVLPFTDDFSTSQWTPVNGTQANKWYIGAAAGNPANGMYISNDNGTTNTYTTSSTSVTQTYREIQFPTSTNPFNLSFDWKANGESSWDYLRVWMVPVTATITPGTQISTTNTPGAIQIGGNINQTTTWTTVNVVLPAATYSGLTKRLVFEWRNDGSGGTQNPAAIDNVNMFEISCPAPTALAATNITTTTADLSWVENGGATDWEIQYGLGNFVPTGGPSIATSTNPYTLTNLQPSSTYRVYVRTKCSLTDSSTWAGPYILLTNCAPITALPWTENFDNMPALGLNVLPLCWVNENPGFWTSTALPLSTTTAGPNSGPNYIRVRYNSTSTVWTPEFELVAGETYEFSFNWAGDGKAGWDGAVYVNSSATITGATMLGAKFVEVTDLTTFNYQRDIFCFTPTTTGIYTFGTKVVIPTSAQNYLSFDDYQLKQIVTTPGIDGSLSACLTGAAVDLNTVITTTSTDGTWNFGLNPNSVDAAGMLNTSTIPAGVHEFLYITAGCAPDTTIATVTIVKPSSAGNDGAIAVCRNQPFNLLQGLGGNVDFGGVWTNPNSVVVPNGNGIASNIPGQYNYQYIVTNGVCPADTAKVVVSVQGCDYLGLEDVVFEGFNMYPNPTSDIVFITNSGSTEVFNYEVLDMNGRVIMREENAINGSSNTELDLRQVEVGVYLVRVFNQKAEKTFRVVKN